MRKKYQGLISVWPARYLGAVEANQPCKPETKYKHIFVYYVQAMFIVQCSSIGNSGLQSDLSNENRAALATSAFCTLLCLLLWCTRYLRICIKAPLHLCDGLAVLVGCDWHTTCRWQIETCLVGHLQTNIIQLD